MGGGEGGSPAHPTPLSPLPGAATPAADSPPVAPTACPPSKELTVGIGEAERCTLPPGGPTALGGVAQGRSPQPVPAAACMASCSSTHIAADRCSASLECSNTGCVVGRPVQKLKIVEHAAGSVPDAIEPPPAVAAVLPPPLLRRLAACPVLSAPFRCTLVNESALHHRSVSLIPKSHLIGDHAQAIGGMNAPCSARATASWKELTKWLSRPSSTCAASSSAPVGVGG